MKAVVTCRKQETYVLRVLASIHSVKIPKNIGSNLQSMSDLEEKSMLIK